MHKRLSVRSGGAEKRVCVRAVERVLQNTQQAFPAGPAGDGALPRTAALPRFPPPPRLIQTSTCVLRQKDLLLQNVSGREKIPTRTYVQRERRVEKIFR